jgi:hypothetical protein
MRTTNNQVLLIFASKQVEKYIMLSVRSCAEMLIYQVTSIHIPYLVAIISPYKVISCSAYYFSFS